MTELSKGCSVQMADLFWDGAASCERGEEAFPARDAGDTGTPCHSRLCRGAPGHSRGMRYLAIILGPAEWVTAQGKE